MYFIPKFKNSNNEFEYYFYFIYFIIFGVNTVLETIAFLSSTAFFAKISDELIGGTYMTLLGNIHFTNLNYNYNNYFFY